MLPVPLASHWRGIERLGPSQGFNSCLMSAGSRHLGLATARAHYHQGRHWQASLVRLRELATGFFTDGHFVGLAAVVKQKYQLHWLVIVTSRHRRAVPTAKLVVSTRMRDRGPSCSLSSWATCLVEPGLARLAVLKAPVSARPEYSLCTYKYVLRSIIKYVVMV